MESEFVTDYSQETIDEISQLANTLSDKLDVQVGNATNRAFNLGCFLGLIPATILILATFFLTGNSWVGAAVMAIMMALGLILFANVAASIARRNTMNRIYAKEIEPEINHAIHHLNIDRRSFDQIASMSLPNGALLGEFLTTEPEPALDTP